MHGAEKSDPLIVAMKSANNVALAAAESVERRSGTKGNADLQSTVRTQSRVAMSQAQDRIRQAVERNRQEKLTALLHHVTVEVLRWAFLSLRRDAAPGIDRITWEDYAIALEDNLVNLRGRVHSGAYRAMPTRRRYIPKPDGSQRPLGIAALEDKIVQAAVVAILTPIYEREFLGFSYGLVGSDPGGAPARHARRAMVAGRSEGRPEERDHPPLARRGSRPRPPHDQRTRSAYLYGAICPAEGKGAALVLPRCNTAGLRLHLKEIAAAVAPGAHAVLLLDRAGWLARRGYGEQQRKPSRFRAPLSEKQGRSHRDA